MVEVTVISSVQVSVRIAGFVEELFDDLYVSQTLCEEIKMAWFC